MFAGFFANVWAKIAACAAIVFAILGALLKVYGAGKTAERARAQEQQLENVATRNTVDADLAHSDDADLRERLRKSWTHG